MGDVHVVLVQDHMMQAMGTRSPKDPVSLKCDLCSKTFTRSWLLKNHQRIHTGEKPYQCSYCEKAFSDKSNLRQHLKIHTTTEKLFQCGICQRTFAQRRYLMKHAQEIHRDVSVSIYESEKKSKFIHTEVVKTPMLKIAPQAKPAPKAVPVVSEIIDRSADHQYLTRHKTKSKSTPDSRDEQEVKDKKYSEQDLKDFIKSNQKTMEKNGYIFIKQNFESLDTEPTLTEMSEIPVTAVADDIALKTDAETGNQLLKVNGKMVYLQMENKPVVLPATSSSMSTALPVDSVPQTNFTNNVKSRKLVSKKDPGPRRLANILKAGGLKKSVDNVMVSPSKGVNLMKPVYLPSGGQAPFMQHVTNTDRVPDPFTLVPVMPGSSIPVQNSNDTFIIPVTLFQSAQHLHGGHSLIMSPANTNITNVTNVTQSNNMTDNCITVSSDHVDHISQPHQQIVEVQPLTVNIDEKGAASDLICAQANVSTPIVSDAPWQGIVNINSEQELLEYINSQSTSALESDQGMTILIQNVENGAVMSLESQAILSGSTNITSVFQDQSTILSDVLPVSGNITEIQVQTDGSTDVHLDTNTEEKTVNESNTFVDKSAESVESELDIVKEEAMDSDDAPSHVMLTEANREHLSDPDDDFTGDHTDHDDKTLIKNDPDEFSDHPVYTTSEVKCEIDVKTGEIMDTEPSEMVIDDPSTNTNMENCPDYKDET